MNSKGKRAALYARVSTTNGQGPSLQLHELRRVARQRGWEVMGEYVDVGQSWSGLGAWLQGTSVGRVVAVVLALAVLRPEPGDY